MIKAFEDPKMQFAAVFLAWLGSLWAAVHPVSSNAESLAAAVLEQNKHVSYLEINQAQDHVRIVNLEKGSLP